MQADTHCFKRTLSPTSIRIRYDQDCMYSNVQHCATSYMVLVRLNMQVKIYAVIQMYAFSFFSF